MKTIKDERGGGVEGRQCRFINKLLHSSAGLKPPPLYLRAARQHV